MWVRMCAPRSNRLGVLRATRREPCHVRQVRQRALHRTPWSGRRALAPVGGCCAKREHAGAYVPNTSTLPPNARTMDGDQLASVSTLRMRGWTRLHALTHAGGKESPRAGPYAWECGTVSCVRASGVRDAWPPTDRHAADTPRACCSCGMQRLLRPATRHLALHHAPRRCRRHGAH